MKTLCMTLALVLLAGLTAQPAVAEERIKDLAVVSGVRSNQLVGYGLVVGLSGTGDQTTQAPFTAQSLRNMLGQLGVTIPANVNLQLNNVAAVSIHAELPPFAKLGQTIDVTVSSIGNAKSLRGGSLLMAPLKGADGQIYAIVQGNLVVGGFGAEGRDGSRISVNVPSAGRIPGGATVERTVPSGFNSGDSIVLNLRNPDFTTAHRLAEAVNTALGEGIASPLDGTSVSVRAPMDPGQRVGFMSWLENVTVRPGEPPARVIVNSRTGTIVMGGNVKVLAAAVAHGSLSVTISESFAVSQPPPFARRGETVVVAESELEIVEGDGRMFPFGPGATLDEIVRAVNQVGAAPGDLIAILEALHQSGALRAELIII